MRISFSGSTALRGGTENIPAIVGLGRAAELASQELAGSERYVRGLRDRLVTGIQDNIAQVKFTGHPEKRLPGHASFCIGAIEGEALIFMLSQHGIYTNTGSACASKALKTSPVLVAVGVPPELAQGSVVFTMNKTNRVEEVDYVVEKLPQVVRRLRDLSPIWREKTAA